MSPCEFTLPANLRSSRRGGSPTRQLASHLALCGRRSEPRRLGAEKTRRADVCCRDAEGTRTEVAVPIRPLLLGAGAHDTAASFDDLFTIYRHDFWR